MALLLGGPGGTGHLAHFLGLLFGGAIEAIYVFEAYGDDGDAGDPGDRTAATRGGR